MKIQIDELTKKYVDVFALKNANINVSDGEFISILGPSGSGKTTLLMLIAGFISPTGGKIKMGDRDITHLRPELRNIGVVFQNYALFPHLRVHENIAFPLKARGLGKTQIQSNVMRAAQLMQIDSFLDRYPSQLSGGQQQRVALARAMVFEPDILLMDEPLGALDRNLREDMKVEIKQIHQRTGSTIIYVTHDQEEALSLSDRVVVMRDGQIEQVSSPYELYHKPETVFTAGFVGETNLISSDRVVVRGNPDNGALRKGRLSVRPHKIQVAKNADQISETEVGVIPEISIESRLFCGQYTKLVCVDSKSNKYLIYAEEETDAPINRGSNVAIYWKLRDEHWID